MGGGKGGDAPRLTHKPCHGSDEDDEDDYGYGEQSEVEQPGHATAVLGHRRRVTIQMTRTTRMTITKTRSMDKGSSFTET